MGHLLLVESWVGAMSTLLPRAIHEAGHRFTFVTRELAHYLRAYRGPGVHPLLTADHVLTTETNDPESLAAQVARWHSVFRFDGVMTSCDYYLTVAARLAAELGLPGPEPAAVARATRKDQTRRAMRDAGLPTGRFAVAEQWPELAAAADRVGYPLICKPVDLCAGMYVRRVGDRAELRTAYEALAGFPVNARQQLRAPQILLEEIFEGPEVSVETVTIDGVTEVIGVTDKRLAGDACFIETGHMFPADLPAGAATAAAEAAVQALSAVGFDRGVAHTELRLTAAGPRVVEINPRPAGNQITELVRLVTGVDLPMVAAQLAAGQRPATQPQHTGVGSAAVAFRLPPHGGVLTSVTGTDPLAAAAEVVEWSVKPPGTRVADPTSNNAYVGQVLVTDPGGGAGARAEQLADQLLVTVAADPVPDTSAAAPVAGS
ncbi:ATP-grasp domain-containing protein [Natronosporangium hydrolyticum]|uniref:ATP-grasp domain-containing protein n=1 Tax=Natronosporangium hydrolyticum TaxID=2811111 RepID=A0A895YA44_9ACTN|nr:ATP-grasp domain-containing protein [Natronosporangium hydrolyticum]QSB14617.1 ATP-grasp domain-containing protein [Natronosporangium hydrolyticum]